MSELDRLAVSLEDFGVKNGLSADLIAELNLVIEELVSNTFNYGAAAGLDPAALRVGVDIARDGGVVTLRIEDNGRAFDPLQEKPPDLGATLEERSVGGLGIHLVRTLMDEIKYSREGDRNLLVMRKRVAGEGA